ncbi:MAG TPA: serine/threonine-protein kinase [Polyangiaceae bacterium]|nr:serine/threonine-protein kinase [Polyangiaceae bacterium]
MAALDHQTGALSAGSDSGANDTQSREEMRAFFQKRVAVFGLLLALMWGLLFVWRVISSLSEDDSPSRAYLPGQALSVASFAATWLLCRSGRRSMRFVRWTEEIVLLVAAAGAVMMCFRVSYAARPDTILFFCLSYTLIARSILVPSDARRTFLLCLFFGVVYVASVFVIHRTHHDPTIYTAAADPRLRLDATTIARRWTVVAALWWTLALTIATATSKVIYGLRREVRDARRLGQYTLLEKLGEGGMGAVYSVRHAMLRRPTAIKLLPPQKFGARSVARFEREVQLTARLTHPNTIRIFDYGRTPDGIFYYAMEYLDGANLADVVDEGGPMPPARVIHILDQVAGALAEAHGIGLIHRDIKPANIFLTEQGGIPDVAKVLDFGLVKQVGETGPDPLTQADTLTGTPLYMAPEAITSPDLIDARTDLYALGAVGYYLLTGHDVFTGRTVVEVCSHHLHSIPVPPSERLGTAIDADLEELILRCLEKDPAERPPDSRSLQRALRACRAARSWSEEDARHWLEAHARSLKARRSRNVANSFPATIDIDLGRRLADPSEQPQAG